MGGSGPHEGNIFVGGFPVCDDHHGVENARVVCRFGESLYLIKSLFNNKILFFAFSFHINLPRMLGYSFGLPTNESHFGKVSNTFGTDEARCLGNETSLLDCPHVAVNDCGSDEAAGVICSNPGWIIFLLSTKRLGCFF